MSNDTSNPAAAWPAIYDFSIFPMGLGDALMWTVKQCMKATEAGKDLMDVYLCSDDKGPFNLFQQYYLHERNYQVHLFELLPAFFCNSRLRNLYVYLDRSTFDSALDRVAKDDAIAQDAIEDYRRLHRDSRCREKMDQALIERVEGFQNIFKFHSERGCVPKLAAPKGCDQHVAAFRQRIGEDRFIVTMQFRMGRLANVRADDADPETKVSFGAWYDFMKVVERKFPDVRFLMLGKVPEIPVMCLRLSNVIVPRLCGLTLGHELTLLKTSDMFIGSGSGFAAMAMFTDVPYVFTDIHKEGYAWAGYPFGLERFPFAAENQRLVFEPTSVPMLLSHFGRLYQEWKRKGKTPGAARERQDEVRTSFLFGTTDELKNELNEYVLERVKVATAFSNPSQAASTLAALEAIWAEYSEIADGILLFHTARALALFQTRNFQEAKKAIGRAIELEPGNTTVADLKKAIDVALK